MSDEKAELTKILNNGNSRGFPVLRAEQVGDRKEFNPVAYNVFGPKILASRGFFQDRALESRFITEEMGHTTLRRDIPINLPQSHEIEATQIRNKLLFFRFRTLHKAQMDEALLDPALEPRLNQVLTPLMSVMSGSEAREDLRFLALQHQRDIAADRGMDVEAQVLETLRFVRDGHRPDFGISVKVICDTFMKRYGDDYERKITPHWIGYLLRRKLGLKTEKRHGTFVIASSEGPKIQHLFERYGVLSGAGDSGDSGDFSVKVRKEQSHAVEPAAL